MKVNFTTAPIYHPAYKFAELWCWCRRLVVFRKFNRQCEKKIYPLTTLLLVTAGMVASPQTGSYKTLLFLLHRIALLFPLRTWQSWRKTVQLGWSHWGYVSKRVCVFVCLWECAAKRISTVHRAEKESWQSSKCQGLTCCNKRWEKGCLSAFLSS